MDRAYSTKDINSIGKEENAAFFSFSRKIFCRYVVQSSLTLSSGKIIESEATCENITDGVHSMKQISIFHRKKQISSISSFKISTFYTGK